MTRALKNYVRKPVLCFWLYRKQNTRVAVPRDYKTK